MTCGIPVVLNLSSVSNSNHNSEERGALEQLRVQPTAVVLAMAAVGPHLATVSDTPVYGGGQMVGSEGPITRLT